MKQSVLSPAGHEAALVDQLGMIMTYGGLFIFVLVIVVFALSLLLPRERRGWMARTGFIVALGIAFPVVVLSALLIYGLTVSRDLRAATDTPSHRILVVGEQWWWRVSYVDPAGQVLVTTANEIHLPVGQPVEFRLTSSDVIHSFWVPSLGGKLDMIPGRTNIMTMTATAPGIYRGQCAEFCGGQHALMSLHVVAHEPDAFEAWWQSARAPAREPTTPETRTGAQIFQASGCGACHAVRGTPADGLIGPDLTHIGSRPSLAAGSFPNNVGTLAGWIASSQHLKPGNRMPSFAVLSGPELRALASYLQSLR